MALNLDEMKRIGNAESFSVLPEGKADANAEFVSYARTNWFAIVAELERLYEVETREQHRHIDDNIRGYDPSYVRGRR